MDGFLAKGQEMRLEVGDKLFKEGILLGHFSIILEGAVEWSRRVNGVDIVVGRREAPTYAGAGNALTGDPPVATGVVIEPMRLLRVERRGLPRVHPAGAVRHGDDGAADRPGRADGRVDRPPAGEAGRAGHAVAPGWRTR